MDDTIDPIAVGRRIKQRRKELGYTTTTVGEPLRVRGLKGYSQQNIVTLEKGKTQEVRAKVMDLAERLETTVDWLLYERGPKATGPRILTSKEYEALPHALKLEITELAAARRKRKKVG